MGDRVLVRNHRYGRDGPDWILANVVEVRGPVTHIVETDDGNRWKHHADQIKEWLSSVLRVTSETGNSHQDEESFDPIMDSELNDAETPER